MQAETDVDLGAASLVAGRTVPAAERHRGANLASRRHGQQRGHMELDAPAAGFGKGAEVARAVSGYQPRRVNESIEPPLVGRATSEADSLVHQR